MTKAELESKIRKIALKSSKFKIGKTGLRESERLHGHRPKNYNRIKRLTWSFNKEKIDHLESQMIEKFKNWKANENKKGGSAGKMSERADRYTLYIIYTKKKRSA